MGWDGEHALALAEAGADVAICDLLEDEGERTRCELEAMGVRAWFGKADATRTEQIDEFIGEVEKNLGPIRILVNNAARPSEGCALADLDEALWREILETNLSSVFYFGKRVAARMMAGGAGGSIINVASINAFVISNIAPPVQRKLLRHEGGGGTPDQGHGGPVGTRQHPGQHAGPRYHSYRAHGGHRGHSGSAPASHRPHADETLRPD